MYINLAVLILVIYRITPYNSINANEILNINILFIDLPTVCGYNNSRTDVRQKTEVNAMDKTEIINTLDKLSDEKLDLFLSYLRDISNSGLPLSPSPQAELEAS